MSLPIFQSDSKDLMLMQTKWASEINPLIKNPMSKGNLLQGIALVSGANVINHKLSRKLQGWQITDINAAVTVYRSAAKNDLTLTLTSSGTATIDLFVF